MKIVIFQPMLKHYRVALFKKLHEILAKNGHELRVVFGTPWEEELKRNDNVVMDNDFCFFEESHWLFYSRVHILQKSLSHIMWSDIVITEQANKHLHNYFLVLLSFFKIRPFAYWGHGLNRQGNPNSLSERIKKILAVQTDWWFAYTSSVADYLQGIGFNRQRITVLNNSMDTMAFKKTFDSLTPQDMDEFRQQYKIPGEARIGLFCGGLHKDKNIDFLLESAVRIKQKNPLFILLIGGDGPQKNLVEQYASRHDFIIYFGPLYGKKKKLAFKCADVFLNPGMVGLAILDAFSASLPLLTTRQAAHSPEIDYLRHGYNGMIGDYSIEDYANATVSILASDTMQSSLKANAQASSNQFTIENMAVNFCEGIENFISCIKAK